MPIYEYVCEACGKLNERIQKVNDPAPLECEGCKAEGKLSKVVSRTSFVLKGGGWYSDLYSSTKKPSASGSSNAASASSGGSTSGSSNAGSTSSGSSTKTSAEGSSAKPATATPSSTKSES